MSVGDAIGLGGCVIVSKRHCFIMLSRPVKSRFHTWGCPWDEVRRFGRRGEIGYASAKSSELQASTSRSRLRRPAGSMMGWTLGFARDSHDAFKLCMHVGTRGAEHRRRCWDGPGPDRTLQSCGGSALRQSSPLAFEAEYLVSDDDIETLMS